MLRVFLGLGSNLDDRSGYLRRAAAMIGGIPDTRVRRVSPVYETEPIGNYLNDFLNCVVEVETGLEPHGMLEQLREIEYRLGRREPGDADRTIDIDILLFGDHEVNEPGLTVPHPRLCQRRFVLQPLCDLAPDVTIRGKTAGEWLKALGYGQRVMRIED